MMSTILVQSSERIRYLPTLLSSTPSGAKATSRRFRNHATAIGCAGKKTENAPRGPTKDAKKDSRSRIHHRHGQLHQKTTSFLETLQVGPSRCSEAWLACEVLSCDANDECMRCILEWSAVLYPEIHNPGATQIYICLYSLANTRAPRFGRTKAQHALGDPTNSKLSPKNARRRSGPVGRQEGQELAIVPQEGGDAMEKALRSCGRKAVVLGIHAHAMRSRRRGPPQSTAGSRPGGRALGPYAAGGRVGTPSRGGMPALARCTFAAW